MGICAAKSKENCSSFRCNMLCGYSSFKVFLRIKLLHFEGGCDANISYITRKFNLLVGRCIIRVVILWWINLYYCYYYYYYCRLYIIWRNESPSNFVIECLFQMIAKHGCARISRNFMVGVKIKINNCTPNLIIYIVRKNL